MIRTEDFDQLEVRSTAELRTWLEANFACDRSIWLVTFKKLPGAPYVSTGEVLDELIAFGWIDGIRRKLDDTRTMQLISARKQQAWAQTYKDRAARLIVEGRMHPAGQAAIDAAKAQGKWNETEAVDALVIPLDLEQALNRSSVADEYFRGAPPSYRRNVLRWLHAARRAETRVARIGQIFATSARGERIPQM